jgi:hypothetical protein
MEDVIPALPWGTGALRQRVLSRWFTLEQAEYCIFADIFKFKTLLRKFASVWDLSFLLKNVGLESLLRQRWHQCQAVCHAELEDRLGDEKWLAG